MRIRESDSAAISPSKQNHRRNLSRVIPGLQGHPEVSDFRCRYQFGYVQGLGNGIVGKWPPESSIVQSNANRIASKPVKGRLLVRVD
jgi:hypothetical protein